MPPICPTNGYPLPTLHGERIILCLPVPDDVVARVEVPRDPEEHRMYGGDGAPPGMDYNAFNAAEQVRLRDYPPDTLLRHFDEAHQVAVDWVGMLEDGQLDSVGRHPTLGAVTVETMVNAIYGHQLMHLRDLPASVRGKGS